jgi:hypothetical protein
MPKCKLLPRQIILEEIFKGCTLYVTLNLARCVLVLYIGVFQNVFGASDESSGFVENGTQLHQPVKQGVFKKLQT